jgi:hypothetical protein
MGLFTSLFSSKVQETRSDKNQVFILIGDLNYALPVAGAGDCQKALEAICGPHRREGIHRQETAWLILEDQDSKDKNRVRVEIRGRQVGYLSPEAAIRYRQQLIARNTPSADGQCQAIIEGGWISSDGRTGLFEVWLDTPSLAR